MSGGAVIAVLNWLVAHWFYLVVLSAFGFFTGVRDFCGEIVRAVGSIGERRHERRMLELETRARFPEEAALPRVTGPLATPGPCAHRNVTPVISAADELVAWLCKSCKAQLPADWAVREEDL